MLIRISLIALLAASSAFCDTLSFLFGGASSLTLTGGVGNPAIATSASSAIAADYGSFLPLGISGGLFSATTANADSFDGNNTMGFAGGGTWSITGGIASLGIAAGSTLATGTFLDDAFIVNSAGRNGLNSGINVTFIHASVLNYFAMTGWVPNTQSMNLSRTGTFSGGAGGSFANATTAPATVGSLTFNVVPEPSTYAMIGGALAGLALLRRRAR